MNHHRRELLLSFIHKSKNSKNVKKIAIPSLLFSSSFSSLPTTFKTSKILSNKNAVSLFSSSFTTTMKRASSEANVLQTKEVPFHSVIDNNNNIRYGKYEMIQSTTTNNYNNRQYKNLKDLRSELISSTTGLSNDGKGKDNEMIWVRARVHSIRSTGNGCFIILRQGSGYTAQSVFFLKNSNDTYNNDDENMLKFLKHSLSTEDVIDIQGLPIAAKVKSCTQSEVELQIKKCFIVSKVSSILPFTVEEGSRSDKEIIDSQSTKRPFANIGQDLRLNNRWIDLRIPSNNNIMRIRSGICQLYREALYKKHFIEIQTPKLIMGESEGGSDVFRLDYFGKEACLAQSPQLYKQMAISSDLERVMEVGPVFRAEKSHTRRHLTEFTGLDMEMSINEHYNEILEVLHDVFKHIFRNIEKQFPMELAKVRKQYFSEPVMFTEEPCIIHWEDGIKMLKDDVQGRCSDIGDFDDLTTNQELILGELVKAKYNTDFFILDRYPSDIRPFYTMPCSDDDRYSNSYDMFLRGQEICSGAQRLHDADMLIKRIQNKGLPLEPLKSYINSFKHGMNPHGGAGIGLDRVVFLYLGLDNVRKGSMFPRDPNRCTP